MTTDNTQELDEIMDKIYDLAYDHLPERGIAIGTDRIKQSILDWHNKRIEEVLGRLDSSMPTPEQLTTKYGYHMPEKQYGYKIGLHDIREVIEAERDKLNNSDGDVK